MRSAVNQIRRNREQRGRDREGGQADQDAKPAVDAFAEQGDNQAGNCHAHGARIHRKAHGRRCDLIGPRQRRKNRLRRKQIDDCEKRGQADYDRAQQHHARVTLHPHWYCFQRYCVRHVRSLKFGGEAM
jgi:hypothetical protein